MTALAAYFGDNATVNYTDASNPELRIKYQDLAAILGWDTAPTNANLDADKWLASILYKAADYEANASDQAHDVVVTTGFKGIATRNNASKTTYSLTATIHTPDSTPSRPDADSV